MTTDRRPARAAVLLGDVLLAGVLMSAALAGCGGKPADPRANAAAGLGIDIPAPMATSAQTSGGTWATFPMGRLDQPLNTFWQLFFEPTGKTSWSDQVEATATATNGGLALTSAQGASLVVGIRPSVDLKFTPLIATSNGARSWADGLIDAQLATAPDALAAVSPDRGLALVSTSHGPAVLTSGGNLSTWARLTAQSTLAATSAGRACGLGRLGAVGFLDGQPLVAGSCGHPGKVGLFSLAGGTWHLSGFSLPGGLRNGTSEVLSLATTGTTTSALVAVRTAGAVNLVLAWVGRSGPWGELPYPVEPGSTVVSFGPAGGGRRFVLLKSASGGEQLLVAGPARGWRSLPSPPRGTATVAFAPTTVSAFVAHNTRLTVWSLSTQGKGGQAWSKRQVVEVPIQFGSSS